MSVLSHTTLTSAWFGLIGLMLVLYVVTDGFESTMVTMLTRTEGLR